MSSRVAKSQQAGGERSLYETLAWCVHRLLDRIPQLLSDGEGKIFAEPCVGNYAIVRAVEQWCEGRSQALPLWKTFDIHEPTGFAEKSLCKFKLGDFLASETVGELIENMKVDVVITNPPFGLAEEFVRKSLGKFPNADQFFLLRLGFLASRKRQQLFRDHGNPDVYVLSKRPSFVGGKNDSADYGWFHWGPEFRYRPCGRLHILMED